MLPLCRSHEQVIYAFLPTHLIYSIISMYRTGHRSTKKKYLAIKSPSTINTEVICFLQRCGFLQSCLGLDRLLLVSTCGYYFFQNKLYPVARLRIWALEMDAAFPPRVSPFIFHSQNAVIRPTMGFERIKCQQSGTNRQWQHQYQFRRDAVLLLYKY